jgi:hypothetical protein
MKLFPVFTPWSHPKPMVVRWSLQVCFNETRGYSSSGTESTSSSSVQVWKMQRSTSGGFVMEAAVLARRRPRARLVFQPPMQVLLEWVVASLWALELPRIVTTESLPYQWVVVIGHRRWHFGHSRLGRYGGRKFLSDWLGVICSRWWIDGVNCGINFVRRGWHCRFHRRVVELGSWWISTLESRERVNVVHWHLVFEYQLSIQQSIGGGAWSKVMLSASLLPWSAINRLWIETVCLS